jgi:hypothetical protein
MAELHLSRDSRLSERLLMTSFPNSRRQPLAVNTLWGVARSAKESNTNDPRASGQSIFSAEIFKRVS